jgi:hypothetical protein
VPDKPPVTAWGEMIRLAREASTPRLSVRAAAKLANMSPENWGHVERGYQLHRGRHRPVTGTPATVAHMAHAVGVTPDRLRAAGNPAAAQILAEMHRADAQASTADRPGQQYDDPTLDYLARTPGLPTDVVRGLIVLARNWREEPDAGATGSQ